MFSTVVAPFPYLDAASKIALAVAGGLLVGLEREWEAEGSWRPDLRNHRAARDVDLPRCSPTSDRSLLWNLLARPPLEYPPPHEELATRDCGSNRAS